MKEFQECEEIEVRLSETVLNFLEEKIYGEGNPEKRRKKVNLPPGKSVTAEDFVSADDGGPSNSEFEEESFSDVDLKANKLPVQPKITNKKAKPECNESIVETKQHTGTSA